MTKDTLKRHQQTAKICLSNRTNQQFYPQNPKFECVCSKEFSRKDSLTRHEKKCETYIETQINISAPITVEIDNSNTTNTTTNNNTTLMNINITNIINTPFSYADITPELIIKKLDEYLTVDGIKGNDITLLSKILSQEILQNEDGMSCYTCPNKKNKVFHIHVYEDGKMVVYEDKNTSILRKTIKEPLNTVINSKLERESDYKNYESASKLRDINLDPREFNNCMAEELPSKPNKTLPEALKKILCKIEENEIESLEKKEKDTERYLKMKQENFKKYFNGKFAPTKIDNKKALIAKGDGSVKTKFICEPNPKSLSDVKIIGVVPEGEKNGRWLNKKDIEIIKLMCLEGYISNNIIKNFESI